MRIKPLAEVANDKTLENVTIRDGFSLRRPVQSGDLYFLNDLLRRQSNDTGTKASVTPDGNGLGVELLCSANIFQLLKARGLRLEWSGIGALCLRETFAGINARIPSLSATKISTVLEQSDIIHLYQRRPARQGYMGYLLVGRVTEPAATAAFKDKVAGILAAIGIPDSQALCDGASFSFPIVKYPNRVSRDELRQASTLVAAHPLPVTFGYAGYLAGSARTPACAINNSAIATHTN